MSSEDLDRLALRAAMKDLQAELIWRIGLLISMQTAIISLIVGLLLRFGGAR